MTWLFYDPAMREHVPPLGHPERPERIEAVMSLLERSGQARSCRRGVVRPATDLELSRVHNAHYLDTLGAFEAGGGGWIEADTWVREGSIRAARLAAGSAIEAVRSVFSGESEHERRAFCAVRPPGHHARPSDAMGFCLFNNIAVAAAAAIAEREIERVLIVDWDVHHGNGTQEMFYDDHRVGFVSIHRYPFYPGSGAADETGTGDGLGFTSNAPLPFGVRKTAYFDAYRRAVEAMADRVRPELVLISAGFDAHSADPIGGLGLDIEDFQETTRLVVEIAETHAQGRIVSILEGGYHVTILADCVSSHLEVLGVEAPFR